MAIGSPRAESAARVGRYVACSFGGGYHNNGRKRLGLYLADGEAWHSALELECVDMRKERLLECALVVTAIMQFIPGFKYGHN